jgi:hypothetical protein
MSKSSTFAAAGLGALTALFIMLVDAVPQLAREAERLAHLIADQMGGPAYLDVARKIAQADIEIRRVQAARASMVNLISVAPSAQTSSDA